jgi:hypothetical protein
MKTKIITLLLLVSFKFFAQTPQGINYQGVARNASGGALTSQNIGLQISVLTGNSSGTAVYTETFNLTTDANGLFSLMIGSGTPALGTFSTIDWATGGSKWLQVSMDASGGTSYQLIGSSQFVSVPYALYAAKTPLKAGNGIALSNDSIINTKPNINQTLSLSNDTLKLSNGGGTVVLPNNNGGMQTLVLSDDITDAQAATQIAAQVGVNTQEIFVVNCTQLTTVNLSSITNAIKVIIKGNTTLTSVNLSGLISVLGDVDISNNAVLTTLNLNNLQKMTLINGLGTIQQNPALTSLSFPALQKIAGTALAIFNNNALTTLSFPVLQNLPSSGGVNISGNPLITSIQFPSLVNAPNGNILISANNISTFSAASLVSIGQLSVQSEPALTSINLPALTGAVNGLYISNNSALTSVQANALNNTGGISIIGNVLTTLSATSLVSSGYIQIQNENSLTGVSFPALTSTVLNITGNSNLTSVSFPVLTTHTNGDMTINSNVNLTSISLPALTTITNAGYIYLNGNKLSTSQVNSLLHTLVLVAPPLSGLHLIDLRQTPVAPPSGQGITDKNTLISQSNTVLTD